LYLKATHGNIVDAKSGGVVEMTGLNRFGDAPQGHRIQAVGGVVIASAPEEITGTALGWHYTAECNSYINCRSATWTAISTATQGGFAMAAVGGTVFAYANSSSGTFVGARYLASLNGVVMTNGGGASYFPGDSAGGTTTGGLFA